MICLISYIAHSQRYEMMQYRTCGQSGLQLPVLSLGLWHNFGNFNLYAVQREMVCTAFALLGASSAAQIKENVGAIKNLEFTAAELAEIDKHAIDLGINLWEKPSTDQRP